MSDSAPVSRSAQRHLDLIRHRAETLALYEDNPAVAEWLSQFQGDDSRRFLERYADERASALVDGHTFWQIAQKEQAALVQEATERLWEIQQRKLFELQCRWRAEEVTLPADQVALTDDFEAWGNRIEACPLVPPITAGEVEGYLAYLRSDACTDADDDFTRPRDWQNYERCRRYLLLQAEGQDPAQVNRDAVHQTPKGLGGLAAMLDDFFLDYPDWYAHCDNLAGPPNLVLYLPDLRGSKEAYYQYAGQTGKLPDPYAPDEDDEDPADSLADELPATPTADPGAPPPLRPLDYQNFGALTDTLMRQLEPAELLRFHEALMHEPDIAPVRSPDVDDDDADEDDIQDALDGQGREAGRVLCEIPERLPIAAHPDWRVALHNTWLNWRKERLATALGEAYAAYEARERAGTPHPSPYPADPHTAKLLRQNRELYREQILKGREVAGEPQDFHF
ncbi:hypothetical protein [Hymenobacter terrenus]|uniref:hypothetical protein n=1 Tax=Hymenobacter terrenus TaxID=1629124 RepID=UPI0006196602|nr:hypothetical protein [Hymenobacter terrenus]